MVDECDAEWSCMWHGLLLYSRVVRLVIRSCSCSLFCGAIADQPAKMCVSGHRHLLLGVALLADGKSQMSDIDVGEGAGGVFITKPQ